MANTLFDKIWDKHVVQYVEDGPQQLYIDRLYCHEVTSPQAFAGMRARGLKCFRPDHIYCMPDHNTPTHAQDKPIEDPVSKTQVDTLAKNEADFGLTHFGMMNTKNGIIKKTSWQEYSRPRTNGVNAITIREDDRVIGVRLTNGENEIIIANRNGRAIRFHESKVRAM